MVTLPPCTNRAKVPQLVRLLLGHSRSSYLRTFPPAIFGSRVPVVILLTRVLNEFVSLLCLLRGCLFLVS